MIAILLLYTLDWLRRAIPLVLRPSIGEVFWLLFGWPVDEI